MKQKEKILTTSWDILIVLDACRYDFFKNNYKDFLSGELSCVYTEGKNTADFINNLLDKSFKDVVYVSTSPWINSKGIGPLKVNRFVHSVVDLWDTSWNSEFGTVLPSEVSKHSKEIIGQNQGKRVIIHYMQPHEPYINFVTTLDKKLNISNTDVKNRNWSIFTKYLRVFKPVLTKFMPYIYRSYLFTTNYFDIKKVFFKFLYKMGLVGTGPGSVVLCLGNEGLKKEYRKNLRLALREVRSLLDRMNLKGKKVVITGDHGELLGESYEYGHCSSQSGKDFGPIRLFDPSQSINHPTLHKVPWLEIKQ